ncbi:MAG: NUDIX hydrolase [Hydrogenophaga sp.]|jgi:8-oxo-dGTP pyrophosphatase MutT (NUDIX family)|uniref:NUDIX hydrolase n=1 Tax=Hydrogenophaga sp. TaxID=1904254 RepID=UPI001E14DEF5|nr:NUDIX hydrolase [Hydrogenophaga sp.]MBW0170445.1 NUDIX hydrolase [Hydrogenophaga sp.]MBW0184882.1 NUDIX hydrolase [Hydrogenophaga sp.]
MAIAINSEEVLTPPVPSATVMVVRDGPAGLEVLLVRRHGNSGVLGGVHVFPGGKLDAADRLVDPAALDRPAVACRDSLGEPGLGLDTAVGLHVAALRETFEECGLLLGVADGAAHVRPLRERTAAGTAFSAVLQDLGLPLNTACVQPWSRWVTPRVPSVTNKRFDTRFFVAAAPDGQDVEHCAREATEAVWLSPRVALERYWAGEIDLAPPQIMSLSQLHRCADAAQVMAAARSRPPALIEPEPFDEEGRRVICYPGDPAHRLSKRVWPGPTRLVHRNQRFEPEGGLAALL